MAEKESLKYTPTAVNHFMRGFALAASKVLWFIRFNGKENIPPKDSFGYIVASNHQAYFDPAWIACPIRQKITFMAWGAAFEWKVVGPLISAMGAFPVHLGGAKALGSIKQALKFLKDGAVLVIFPEGERAFGDGQLLEFKEGVASLAIRAQVPVLPVTIKGGNRIWPQGQKWPHFFRRVDVIYHPLVYPPKDEGGSACDTFIAELRDIIADPLDGSS
jgi:1-acyl-sn-glycerol-3-phosphate acyltransferase